MLYSYTGNEIRTNINSGVEYGLAFNCGQPFGSWNFSVEE